MHKKNECLSEHEIGAYMDSTLSSDLREDFEKRLIECKQCWEDFVAISQSIIQKDEISAEDAPEYIINKAIRMYPEKSNLFDIILELVKDSIDIIYHSPGFDILAPLPTAALRSGKTEYPKIMILKKSFEYFDVKLDIEKVNVTLCNIRVVVDDLNKGGLINALRVELISQGRELVSNPLIEGKTYLEGIETGQYTIKIQKKLKVLGEIAIKIQ
jgi:hypothetical protein